MKLLFRAVLAFACALALNTISQAQTMTPTITWGPINAVTLGTALTSAQLNATANVSGTFVYSPAAGTVLPVGLGIIAVTFIPSDTVDFTNATATNTVLVVAPSLTPVYALNLPAIDSVNWAALLNQNFVALDKILSGVTPLTGTLNAPTASALFATPTQCSAGQAFLGIDVHGNSVGCFTPSGGGGGGGLTSFTVSNLSPLFTATLGGSPLTNPALAFTLSNAAANTVFGNFTGSSATPSFSASPVFSAALLTNFPTLNQNTTGNAATASALASTPTLCSTGTAPTGILANGNATGCASISSGGITALTGDATASGSGSVAVTVVKINGTSLAGLTTGILKNTTGTGVPSIAVAADFPTLNQNTTGSAATLTTARTIAGTSFNGSANVSLANKFIVQGTSDTGLSAAQFMGSLGTGIIKNTTSTGVFSIAIASDFPTLNQSTTGTAANITGVLGSGSMPTFTGDVTNSGLAMTVGKINGTSLAGLTTGLLKNTTATGVPSIATAGTDYVIPSGSITGNAATATALSTAGTTTTVLHGNAAGAPTYSAVALATDVTGNLPNANLASQSANTVLGSLTATTPSGLAIPSCSSVTSNLIWTSGTGFGCGGIPNATLTISTTAIAANTCTIASTINTLTGLSTTSTINITPQTDVASITGWGATGGLVIDAWPASANTMQYKVCNQTSASITPGASVTFNVSAR